MYILLDKLVFHDALLPLRLIRSEDKIAALLDVATWQRTRRRVLLGALEVGDHACMRG